MKLRSVFIIGLFVMSFLAVAGFASALTITDVKLDGDSLMAGNNYVEKNNNFQVRVVLDAAPGDSYSDVQVSAYIRGDKNDNLIQDVSPTFNIENNTQYVEKLTLNLPENMQQDSYTLYVRVENRDLQLNEVHQYALLVRTSKHALEIRDVILSPSNGVISGRALLATVRITNRGLTEEDNVKVTFSIPDLNLDASDYIDSLSADGNSDSSKSTQELYLRIPPCTKAGNYDGEVQVDYNDGNTLEKKSVPVQILADDTCNAQQPANGNAGTPSQGQTVISLAADAQDVTKGTGGAVYPIVITNLGTNSQTYVLSVTGGDWGTFRVSPSVLTVGSGESSTASVYVSANQAASVGTEIVAVDVKVNDNVVKELTLKANVVNGQASGMNIDLKTVLQVTLFVLLVILVVLGLVIGFRKLKGNDEEGKEETSAQSTYY